MESGHSTKVRPSIIAFLLVRKVVRWCAPAPTLTYPEIAWEWAFPLYEHLHEAEDLADELLRRSGEVDADTGLAIRQAHGLVQEAIDWLRALRKPVTRNDLTRW